MSNGFLSSSSIEILDHLHPPRSALFSGSQADDHHGSMHRFLSPLKSARIRCLSPSGHHRSLVSVASIRDNVSKFVITSRSTDPFLNLAIEDHLLRTSEPNTHILFTYVNRPCVVLGRNQNPWIEANLGALTTRLSNSSSNGDKDEEDEKVELVRRRSGGGTVFHDRGNLNYCFIVPNDKAFHRDRHAKMVVDAIQRIPSELSFDGKLLLPPILKRGIRVNERHDIVMPARLEPETEPGLGRTTVDEGQTVKVSGSAYKLTRGRALHHGTLLISSPNLSRIGQYLHSPARPFIRAKGVESVRSQIGNLSFQRDSSAREILMSEVRKSIANVFTDTYGRSHARVYHGSVSDDDIPALPVSIRESVTELQGREWKYLQTPTFTFSYPVNPAQSQPRLQATLEFHHGVLARSQVFFSPTAAATSNSQANSADQTQTYQINAEFKPNPTNKNNQNNRLDLLSEDWSQIHIHREPKNEDRHSPPSPSPTTTTTTDMTPKTALVSLLSRLFPPVP